MTHSVVVALKSAYSSTGYLGSISFAPTTAAVVQVTERALGLSLPPLLRELYLQVANGGFGPSDGVIGLPGGATEDGRSLAELYGFMCVTPIDDRHWKWPRFLLPILDWGCAIKSCVDCEQAPYAVIRFDPNGHQRGTPWESAFSTESPSLEAWFEDWIRRVGLKTKEGQ